MSMPPADLGIDVDTILQPVIDVVKPFLAKLSLIVGGIFGLYVLLFLLRVYYEHMKVKLLRDIRYNTDQLNKHYELPYSTQKKSLVGRFVHHVRGGDNEEEDSKKEEHKKNHKKGKKKD